MHHPEQPRAVEPSFLSTPHLLDRDHSILRFNERVLNWAERVDVPLLERLRYLCIVSSNLDEFFEVRAEPHLHAKQTDDAKGIYTTHSFDRLSEALHVVVERQYTIYNDKLLPAFARKNIHVYAHSERSAALGSGHISTGKCARC